MIIYAMSDIHGCLSEFDFALSLVEPHLEKPNTMLILLGDYIHGPDSYGVLDRIMALQRKWGTEKVIALQGNHEEMALDGRWTIGSERYSQQDIEGENDDKYLAWMKSLPLYHVECNTIFAHAGIDEEAGDWWEWGTAEEIFTWKYPAQTGTFDDGTFKIVAGHVGTSEIAGDPYFHDIYYDGESHYFIDGTVLRSGHIPVLMVDTETDKYYRVTKVGGWLILPYGEEC